jgi:hypothetical protein
MSLAELDQIEVRIIGRYLNRLADFASLHPDHLIRVFDGEEFSYEGPFDRKAIEAQIGITDETTVSIRTAKSEKLGGSCHSVLFIHGNLEDVVSGSQYTVGDGAIDDLLLQDLDRDLYGA